MGGGGGKRKREKFKVIYASGCKEGGVKKNRYLKTHRRIERHRLEDVSER